MMGVKYDGSKKVAARSCILWRMIDHNYVKPIPKARVQLRLIRNITLKEVIKLGGASLVLRRLLESAGLLHKCGTALYRTVRRARSPMGALRQPNGTDDLIWNPLSGTQEVR